MTRSRSDTRIQLLTQIVDQAFQRKSWHGTTLKGSIRGLTVDVAIWRPTSDRHNIWELILHTAYWKYIVRRRLTRDKTLRFDRSPSNWPALPQETIAKLLKVDITLLQSEHDQLMDAIEDFPPSHLDRCAPESSWSFAEHIHGAAAHDLYHAGQIQLLKKLRV
jgi:hypothetical protein